VNEGRAVARIINLLEINDELGRVVFGVGEDLGTEESDDVARDDLNALVAEVCIIDAKVGVEPIDLVCDKFVWDKALSAAQ